MGLQVNSAFPVFAVCAAILVLKMMLVGHYTAMVRIRRKTYLNPEDAQQFSGMVATLRVNSVINPSVPAEPAINRVMS